MATKLTSLKRGLERGIERRKEPASTHVEIVNAIKNYILARLMSTNSNVSRSLGPKDLTVGIEQEFFLLDLEGNPVTHEKGQEFLAALAKQKDWYVRDQIDSIFGKMIERVSLETSGQRYTVVKYDHHPHLFEIAFAYVSDLHGLSELVSKVYNCLREAEKKSHTKIGVMSRLSLAGGDPRITSPLPTFQGLRHYRTKLYEMRQKVPNYDAINYAATIAATQVHIGNTKWWERPGLVEWLYSREPEILTLYADSNESDASLRNQALFERWEGYADVFAGYPLVGYPRMEHWNLDSWIYALLESPLAAGPDKEWAGKSLSELTENPFSDWGDFISSVRDLQIIRPKLFGTLEFRADPTQSNLEGVLNSAAMRLGLCSYGMSQSDLKSTFAESQTIWWDIVRRSKPAEIKSAISMAEQGLRIRGLGEEIYLKRKGP